MSSPKPKILIVDDEAPMRLTLSAILNEFEYSVQTADDGFSALAEIRREIPNVLISELHMPRMSGFELLSVVRRRCPAIQVIAMSSAYDSDHVPPGVAADAFYEKGTHPGRLFQLVKAMSQSAWLSMPDRSHSTAPIWIPRNGHDPSGEEYVMVACPECLRTFPRVLGKRIEGIQQANCIYCTSPIQYAIVQPTHLVSPHTVQRKPGAGSVAALRASDPSF
ncbi:MAG: response regulator [Acidobacteriaceae bacterium]